MITRNRIYDYFFIALLLLVFGGILKLLAPFSGALLAALICAVTFFPMYKSFHRWFPRSSPTVRAALADSLVFIFFVTPVIFLVWIVSQESALLGATIKQGNTAVAQWQHGKIDCVPLVSNIMSFSTQVFDMRPNQFQETLAGQLNKGIQYATTLGSAVAQNALGCALDFLIMFFTLFFLFRDGKKVFDYVQNLVPMRREDKEHLTHRIHDTVIGVVRGWLLTSFIQGIVAMIGYFIARTHGAILLGALTALTGLLPVIGTIGVWVPVGIFYLVKRAYLKGIFLLLWGALAVVGLTDTILRPYLVGKKAELPLFVLFFALLGGVEVWGAKGIILGPLLAAIAPVLLDMYRHRYLRRTDSPEIAPVHAPLD